MDMFNGVDDVTNPDLDIGIGNTSLALGAGVSEIGQSGVDALLDLGWFLLAPDLDHEGALLQVVQGLSTQHSMTHNSSHVLPAMHTLGTELMEKG